MAPGQEAQIRVFHKRERELPGTERRAAGSRDVEVEQLVVNLGGPVGDFEDIRRFQLVPDAVEQDPEEIRQVRSTSTSLWQNTRPPSWTENITAQHGRARGLAAAWLTG